jgi:hypothetical protein
LANEYGMRTDNPGPALYNIVAEKAAAEAAAATGNNTADEINKQKANLRLEAGPQTQRQQIAGNVALLKTQAETVENNFKQAMGASSDELGRPVIYDQNKPLLDKWKLGPQQPKMPAGVPKEATHVYKDASGNVQGYAVNGKYVALAPTGAK